MYISYLSKFKLRMDRRPELTFSLRRPTNGQQAHENMLNIANHQRNAKQNHSEIPPHTCKNGYHPQDHVNKDHQWSWTEQKKRKNINKDGLRWHHASRKQEELKSLLMKVKEKSENFGLKLHNQKMKVMSSGPITLWQTDGETMETVTDFIFLGSKITIDGECSHEIKT